MLGLVDCAELEDERHAFLIGYAVVCLYADELRLEASSGMFEAVKAKTNKSIAH